MSATRVPTELEALSELETPTAEELAGRFPLTLNENPASQAGYEQVMSELTLGDRFTDHMAHMRWAKEEGWSERGIIPYGPLALTPGVAVLHYSQNVFESIKAYRRTDGSIWTFHPAYNAARLNHSTSRLTLPRVDRDDSLVSLVDYIRADEKWIPTGDGASLHLRPLLLAFEKFLSVRTSSVVGHYVTGSPSGPYFASDFTGVVIWIVKGYYRAGPGGTGFAKCGGNYTASFMPQLQAVEKGFSQVCFLDTYEEKYPEELDGMNMFVVMADDTVRTPEFTGIIFEGGTRSAICRMLRSQGTPAYEEMIALDELAAGIRSGEVAEIFACGTAAVVIPITRLMNDGSDVKLPVGETTKRIHRQLTDIQVDYTQGPFGWMYRLVWTNAL